MQLTAAVQCAWGAFEQVCSMQEHSQRSLSGAGACCALPACLAFACRCTTDAHMTAAPCCSGHAGGAAKWRRLLVLLQGGSAHQVPAAAAQALDHPRFPIQGPGRALPPKALGCENLVDTAATLPHNDLPTGFRASCYESPAHRVMNLQPCVLRYAILLQARAANRGTRCRTTVGGLQGAAGCVAWRKWLAGHAAWQKKRIKRWTYMASEVPFVEHVVEHIALRDLEKQRH
jgi:hypothetical protein